MAFGGSDDAPTSGQGVSLGNGNNTDRCGGGTTSGNVPETLGRGGGGGATRDLSRSLLAAISATGPATAGGGLGGLEYVPAGGLRAGLGSGLGCEQGGGMGGGTEGASAPAAAGESLGDSGTASATAAAAASGTAIAGASAAAASGTPTAGVSGAAAGGEGASEAGDDATAAPAADDATPEPAADDATPEPDADDATPAATSWSSRAWTGMGRWPYLLAGYMAMHGSRAQTCKRPTAPSSNTHPVTPEWVRQGIDGENCHLAVRMLFFSSRTWKSSVLFAKDCSMG